jgi:hypothetical protein
VVSTSAGAATGSKAYLIGSSSPLTQAHTQALKDAGAQLTNVYKNFGGAAAVIPDSKVSAVRSLSFVRHLRQPGHHPPAGRRHELSSKSVDEPLA